MSEHVAAGPGPRAVRIACVVVAVLYYIGLVRHPPQWPGLRAVGFFTESTCLFPRSSAYAIDYRLDGWSCERRRWERLDPRAYFPIEADDKESRFQRLAYFYQANRPTLQALDAWIAARHDHTDDGIAGPLGGIRLYKWLRPLPAPGDPVERYVYAPLATVPKDQHRDLFYTSAEDRKARCGWTP